MTPKVDQLLYRKSIHTLKVNLGTLLYTYLEHVLEVQKGSKRGPKMLQNDLFGVPFGTTPDEVPVGHQMHRGVNHYPSDALPLRR